MDHDDDDKDHTAEDDADIGDPTPEQIATQNAELGILLASEGLSWSEIAQRLHYADEDAAFEAVVQRINELAPVSKTRREAERRRQINKLAELFAGAVEPKLASTDPAEREVGIAQARKFIGHLALLLDVAPSQTPIAQRLRQLGLEVKP